MNRRHIGSGVPWETEFGYSRATRIGDRILVSGTTATGPDGPVALGDPGAQTRYAIEKIRTAIESLGGTLDDVVRTRIHVKPGTDWEAVARVHGEFFSAVRPACTLTYADLIGEEYLVEIEVEAVVGSGSGDPDSGSWSPKSRRPRTARASVQCRRIYGVDVGSTLKGNFAWTRIDPDEAEPVPVGSHSIAHLCQRLVEDLRQPRSVALGFEAPLFIPVPMCADNLSKGRNDERDRSWAAPAGAYVATLALHQAAWILKYIAVQLGNSVHFTLDPLAWPPQGDAAVLFCWEAFVAGDAHATETEQRGHLRDAATATMYFHAHEHRLKTAVSAERPLSLIGAAATWSGLAEGRDLIHTPTVVLRPTEPYDGEFVIEEGR